MPSEKAVSETVSVIVVLSLVVILSLVVAAIFFGDLHLQQKTALVTTDVANKTLDKINVFTVFHRAGDNLYLGSSAGGMYELGIYIDNRTNSTRARPVSGLNTVKPGDTLYVFYNKSRNAYCVTTDAETVAKQAQSITDCPLRVRLVDESAHLVITTYNWTCVPAPLTGPAPTITGRSNGTVYRGWFAYERITGTGFLLGATASLNRTSNKIAASSCAVRSSSEMFCTFNLYEAKASPATYNISVTNPDGKTITSGSSLATTLSSPAPTYSGNSNTSGYQGRTVVLTNLRGNYFQPTTKFTFVQKGAPAIPVTSVTVRSSTSMTGSVVIPATAPTGYYSLIMNNTDIGNSTRVNAFFVYSSAPTVTGRSNSTIYRGWTAIERITGSNFLTGATAALNRTSNQIASTSCNVTSSTVIICTFDLAGAAASPPTYNISVTNPDGRTGTYSSSGTTVASPPPTYSGRTPTTGVKGSTVTITVTGNYFQPGTTVRFWRGSASYLSGLSPTSRTSMTGTWDIPAGAQTGAYNLTITNPDGLMVIRNNTFTVYAAAAPTITGISPASGPRGSGVAITVTGSDFNSFTRVRLYNSTTGGSVYIAPAGAITPTQITTTFTVPTSVVKGPMNVRVYNTSSTGQYTQLNGAYTLT